MRTKLMYELLELYRRLYKMDMSDTAEDILINNNASEDDSDPDEGFMITMSDADLTNSIQEMKQALSLVDPDSVQSVIYAISSKTLDASREWCEGFLDACKMIEEEYGIELDGLH